VYSDRSILSLIVIGALVIAAVQLFLTIAKVEVGMPSEVRLYLTPSSLPVPGPHFFRWRAFARTTRSSTLTLHCTQSTARAARLRLRT